MYSPRSVSTTSTPAASSASLSAHSSVTMDFDFTALRTPWCARDLAHDAVDVLARLGPVHDGAARRGVALEFLQVQVEVASARSRIAAAAERISS